MSVQHDEIMDMELNDKPAEKDSKGTCSRHRQYSGRYREISVFPPDNTKSRGICEE
jgi:hypothetical protein